MTFALLVWAYVATGLLYLEGADRWLDIDNWARPDNLADRLIMFATWPFWTVCVICQIIDEVVALLVEAANRRIDRRRP